MNQPQSRSHLVISHKSLYLYNFPNYYSNNNSEVNWRLKIASQEYFRDPCCKYAFIWSILAVVIWLGRIYGIFIHKLDSRAHCCWGWRGYPGRHRIVRYRRRQCRRRSHCVRRAKWFIKCSLPAAVARYASTFQHSAEERTWCGKHYHRQTGKK